MNTTEVKSVSLLHDLVELMRKLRSNDGCPWDKEQSHASLKPHLVEETYEVIDAIDSGDPAKIKEELADLFFHIIFHCQIAKEKGYEERKFVVDGLPKHLPALQKAQKLQKKVSKVGFDWKDIRDVIAKIDEELEEVKDAIQRNKPEHIEEEVGDLLFSVVNLSRFLKLDTENVLHKTIYKFVERFKKVEMELAALGKDIEKCSLEEMDALWNKAKGKNLK